MTLSQVRPWIVYFWAVLAGLWSAFQFGAPGAGYLYNYVHQGQVDVLASEIPEDNPPRVPPVTTAQFLLFFIPSSLGVLGSIFYAALAFASAWRKTIFPKTTYFAIGWDLANRAFHILSAVPFLLLPSLEQNVTMGIVWWLPFALGTFFSLFWLSWTRARKNSNVS
jgi:hypothetical protein